MDNDRARLHKLAALMGWPRWDWERGGDATFAAGVTFWADFGYTPGLLVYVEGSEHGRIWNPLTSERDALELAEHLTPHGSVWCLEVDRAYQHTYGEGPRGWSASFFQRGRLAEATAVWAPTLARAICLAALKALGQ